MHIIDDDALIRASTSFLLSSHGYATEIYANGEEFLAEAKLKQPPAYGTVAADGSFTLHTEFGEGAAAGDYAAFVTWIGVDANDAEKRISKLPPKYADQEKPVLKVSVKEQKNELEPFRLR